MSDSHNQLRGLVEQALDLPTSADREALLAACPDPALAAELSGKSLNQWAEEVLDRAAG